MKLRFTCAALMVAVASLTLFAGDSAPKDDRPRPAAALPDACIQAVKAAYPNATLGEFKINVDRGVYVYNIPVTGDKNVGSVEIAATKGILMQGELAVTEKNLPDAVAKAAAAAAGTGATFSSAEKLDLYAQFDISNKPYNSGAKVTLVALAKPVTVYDVTYTKDGTKGVVRLDADGKALSPINWMKRASADVPAGKLVIRVNLGCSVDYTDLSGVVWSADRDYAKDTKWGALDGRSHYRTNLTILGTDAPYIYDSERDKEGKYRFDVPNGTYTVRVHMCESWEGAKQANIREFGFKVQGKELVNKMDIAGAAGGWLIPLVKEFKDIAVTDGKLVIEPFSNNNRDQHPSIEAYEVYAQ